MTARVWQAAAPLADRVGPLHSPLRGCGGSTRPPVRQ